MTNEPKSANSSGHGSFERRDIGVAGVLYFLLGLGFAGLLVHFIATGLFHGLEKYNESQQTPVSPLVRNAAKDTRHLPPEYKGNYEEYLQKNFPTPQLEIDERTQLNEIRLHEEQTLSTYDWIDEQAGTVRIPIDRAMDLIVQRGLPVREATTEASAGEKKNLKGNKQ
jgi:hypothetical protein